LENNKLDQFRIKTKRFRGALRRLPARTLGTDFQENSDEEMTLESLDKDSWKRFVFAVCSSGPPLKGKRMDYLPEDPFAKFDQVVIELDS